MTYLIHEMRSLPKAKINVAIVNSNTLLRYDSIAYVLHQANVVKTRVMAVRIYGTQQVYCNNKRWGNMFCMLKVSLYVFCFAVWELAALS